MQFPTWFLTLLVSGAVLLAAAGAVLLAWLFLRDKIGKQLW